MALLLQCLDVGGGPCHPSLLLTMLLLHLGVREGPCPPKAAASLAAGSLAVAMLAAAPPASGLLNSEVVEPWVEAWSWFEASWADEAVKV